MRQSFKKPVQISTDSIGNLHSNRGHPGAVLRNSSSPPVLCRPDTLLHHPIISRLQYQSYLPPLGLEAPATLPCREVLVLVVVVMVLVMVVVVVVVKVIVVVVVVVGGGGLERVWCKAETVQRHG